MSLCHSADMPLPASQHDVMARKRSSSFCKPSVQTLLRILARCGSVALWEGPVESKTIRLWLTISTFPQGEVN
jgi:hypothetical protein